MDYSSRVVRIAEGFRRIIATVNDWTGKIFAWLVLPLTAFVVMEVVLRYVFNKPTIWAWDVNVQLQATLIVLGGGFALLHRAHVSIDILVNRLSLWRRAILDAFMALFLFGGVGLLLWRSALAAQKSVIKTEEYVSAWGPPIYPLKVVILVGVSLLLLQGIANFIDDLATILIKSKADSKK
jgi:TRAP-type mannitol/chloroaromatic compound transport system permease small subunit